MNGVIPSLEEVLMDGGMAQRTYLESRNLVPILMILFDTEIQIPQRHLPFTVYNTPIREVFKHATILSLGSMPLVEDKSLAMFLPALR